jgi:large subunit ribosomal protein L18
MTRQDSIKLRHKRLRKKVSGTSERPRLAVNFSGRHIRAQVIDDTKGVTIAAASTQEKTSKAGANVANATTVGKLVADRAKGKSISKVVFDRGGFQYMGKVKALADAAREAGLEF